MARKTPFQIHSALPHWANLLRKFSAVLVFFLTPALALAQPPVPSQHASLSKRDIAKLVEEALPQFDIDPRRLPKRFRLQVSKRIHEYTGRHRKALEAMLRRSTSYLPMIKRTLKQHELPTYFAYIPLVESSFRVNAMHPKSGARGLWQLMPLTARSCGLQVSKHFDERIDPQRATQAAARYLRRLYNRFGPAAPLHILAAYNHGETNLAKAMRRARTQDIWHLYTYRRIPYQTRDYLIKMVTLWVIVEHAARFQLAVEDTVPSQRLMEIPSPQAAKDGKV